MTHGFLLFFVQGRTWSPCIDQFSIPDASNLQFVPNRLNVTLHFTSSSWVTVADGTGRLYLLHSGDRKSDEKWKVSVFLHMLWSSLAMKVKPSVVYRVVKILIKLI